MVRPSGDCRAPAVLVSGTEHRENYCRRRWEAAVGGLATGVGSRLKPAEGDLLYMTMTGRLFEIKYVEQLSKTTEIIPTE